MNRKKFVPEGQSILEAILTPGLLLIAIAFTLAFICAPAFSQQVPIPVGTGSKTGSYYKFMTQAAKVCQDAAPVDVEVTAGSTDNLDAMINNKYAMGISQLDILDLYKKTKDMSNIKLVAPLFAEQVHFVARNNETKTTGGFNIGSFNIGGTKSPLRSISDLNGRTVAAAGGSYKTAQVISYVGGISMHLVDSGTADQAIQGVVAGKYDAAILVGAQPLGTITQMGDHMAQIRLLPVSEDMAAKLSSIYVKSQPLTYRGMGTGGDNIPSIQVMSALMTQNYPKSTVGDEIYRFQQCLLSRAAEQATIPGSHPAWRNLKLTTGLNWDAWHYAGVDPTASVHRR